MVLSGYPLSSSSPFSGYWIPAFAGMTAAGLIRPLLASIVRPRIVHPQFLDLARERVAPPAEQTRGILAPSTGMFQGGFDHDALERRRGAIQQTGFTAPEFLICPAL